tara:strand:- start:1109 stop:1261 length:153 start_codon:yes stop_codon:yes gene_type:complete
VSQASIPAAVEYKNNSLKLTDRAMMHLYDRCKIGVMRVAFDRYARQMTVV